jgi:hypothetical protein
MLSNQPLEFGLKSLMRICPKCLVSRDWDIGHFGQESPSVSVHTTSLELSTNTLTEWQ